MLPAIAANKVPSAMVTDDNPRGCTNESWFENRPVRKHFNDFFETLSSDNLLESSPIDGTKWLPTCIDRQQVYQSYVQDTIACGVTHPYGAKNFFQLWDDKFPDIKCRADRMRCDLCDEIETKLNQSNDDDEKERLKKKKKKHLQEIQESRQFHDHCKLEAIRKKGILMLGDGGDKFGLPRKSTMPKSLLTKTTLAVGTYFVDVYNGSGVKKSHGYYYQEYNTRDAMLPGICIEAFHRTLEKFGLSEGKLAKKTLFICTDNTSKEGKNFFLLGYLQSLVERGQVERALFYNLHVGHTHFEVDQSIGLDKRFLWKKNVFTLPSLISMLNSRRSEHSSAEELDTCRDWRNCIAQYYRPLTGINKNGWKCFSISAKGIRGRVAYDG